MHRSKIVAAALVAGTLGIVATPANAVPRGGACGPSDRRTYDVYVGEVAHWDAEAWYYWNQLDTAAPEDVDSILASYNDALEIRDGFQGRVSTLAARCGF